MVRSSRGRSAALRHLWSWPVYSARRFILVLLAVLLVVVVGGKISRSVLGGPQQPSRPVPEVSTSTSSVEPTVAPSGYGVSP